MGLIKASKIRCINNWTDIRYDTEMMNQVKSNVLKSCIS